MNAEMSEKIIHATIEILGKYYPIRCPESELQSLNEAAQYLNQKMLEVQNSGKVINLERIAIISALNIAYQFLQMANQKNHYETKISERIQQIKEKVESALGKTLQTDMIYAIE